MKKRNIKKRYTKSIVAGWRQNLTLKVPYRLLGIEGDFLTLDKICKLLNLEWSGKEASFCDEWNLVDKNQIKDGIPKFVILRIVDDFINDGETVSDWLSRREMPENMAYILDGSRVYYIEGIEGYRNPEYDIKKNPRVPYWLFNDPESEDGPNQFLWVTSDGDNPLECLRLFINNKKFGSDLFSGNFFYGLISGNDGSNLQEGLLKDLSGLCNLCKTTYEDFFDDYVEICFAIRCKEYIKPFMKILKRIIVKNRIKNLL